LNLELFEERIRFRCGGILARATIDCLSGFIHATMESTPGRGRDICFSGETEIEIWAPNHDGTDVQPSITTQNTITTNSDRAYDNVSIPVLGPTANEGDQERITSMMDGSLRVIDYYAPMLPRPILSTAHFNNCDGGVLSAAGNGNGNGKKRNGGPADSDTGHTMGNTATLQIRPPLSTRRNHIVSRTYRPASEGQRDGWATLVSRLLTKLEMSMGSIGNSEKDVAYAMGSGKIQVAIFLIRAKEEGARFQLNFLLGDKKWRHRRSSTPSLVRITMRGTSRWWVHSAQEEHQQACSCHEFEQSSSCGHIDAVLGDHGNRLRITSMASRRIGVCSERNINSADGIHENGASDDWNVEAVKVDGGEDVQIWNVFDRSNLSSLFRTSAIVFYDLKPSRGRQSQRDRVWCTICPYTSTHRMLCVHETKVKQALANSELDGATEGANEFNADDYDDGMDNQGDNGQLKADSSDEISFLSRMPRFFFPCPSDDEALKKILNGVIERTLLPIGDRMEYHYMLGETNIPCRDCQMDLSAATAIQRIHRRSNLHTLHHGTLIVEVVDLKCPHCRTYNPFDGYSDGLFCFSKIHIFTRELLDSWVWDICGTGGTFRDTFSSWSSKAMSASATFHRLGREPSISRQNANEAFSEFLLKLRFPREEDLHQLFSCATCEKETLDGQKRMDGIVMDGTALGILGTLPNFNRAINVVEAVQRVPKRQYIMPTPIYRGFVDSILSSAMRAHGAVAFTVDLKKALWDKRNTLIPLFFTETDNTNDETYVVRKFISLCLAITSSADIAVDEEDEYNDDAFQEFTGKLILRHKFLDVDLRRTIVDFGRCFGSGSIAGGALRDYKSEVITESIISSLRSFAQCFHPMGESAGAFINRPICESCATALLEIGKRSEAIVPSASRLVRALAESCINRSRRNIRPLAERTADVLQKSLVVRRDYFERFAENQNEAVLDYTSKHKTGDNMNGIVNGNWLSEASTTGELFPGRPVVRPSMKFGISSRTENMRSCRKNYLKSDSHSPGIFTVQCVCRFPKLIGLSVMMECEGISTALSALLSRFKRLPRVCYYDNACNMARSIILRVPWVNDECLVVCDRFHYRGHKCNSIYDPNSYYGCTPHATSGAEAVNHLWNFSKAHLRFLRPDNMMPFLAARAVFLNVRASIREARGRSDISSNDFRKYVQEKWACTCSRCQSCHSIIAQ